MNKVLIMNALYSPNIGGVENSITEIAKTLNDMDFEVDVLCSDRNNENDEELSSFESKGFVSVYRYKCSFGFMSFFVNIFRAAVKLRKLYRENNYSYVVSRSYFMVLVSFFSGVRNVKYIVPEVSLYAVRSFSDLGFMTFISNNVKYFLQFIAFLISKEVFVFSKSMVEQVSKSSFGIVKPVLVRPGINFGRFNAVSYQEKKEIREIYGIEDNKKVLLALGRFSEVKQFDLPILAMKYLPDDCILLLVGSGPEGDSYKHIIKREKLCEKVKIFGATTAPEVFYQLSDVFLMTSRYESFGQTILEAVASGLQVIAFSSESGVNTNVKNMLEGCEGIYLLDSQEPKLIAEKSYAALDSNYNYLDIQSHNKKVLVKRYSWLELLVEIGIFIK